LLIAAPSGWPFSRRDSFVYRVAGLGRNFAGIILCFCALPVLAQINFYTITTNGPSSNRVNIVFLAEGYRTNQYAQFLTDATNAANLLLTNQPYAEYRSYQNVFAIAVPSVDSGSDHLNYPSYVNTYFNSSFDSNSDYYISIPTNSQGQGKVDALLNTYLPQADLTVLLVNDPLAGGSDGGGKTAIVSRGAIYSFGQFDILVHETGHVLAGLGDEYTDANPGYPDIEEPNTTTNRAAIKWTAWIAASTPVPTPPTGPYANVVGLFEGAHYHTTNWYRPKLNCMMKSFGVGFCEVCQEAMVLSFYRQVRLVDSYAPATTNLSTTNQVLNFSLNQLQPTGHALAIQWLTNGTPITGATNASLGLMPADLGNGSHIVLGRVTDTTPLVRTDTSNLLSQTLTWAVTVSLPQLQLTAPRWLGGGKFAVHMAGVAPQGFSIQASTNLLNWLSLSTNTLVNGQYDYTNTQGTNFPIRFFRAVTPP